MLEEFRIFKDEPKLSVSNFGKVYNLKIRKFLHIRKDKNGYSTVRVATSNKVKTYKIHRLVGYCFLELVEGKNIINHKDGDPSNNISTNLEWCTHQENIKHAFDIGLISRKGSKNAKAQVHEDDVHLICKWFEDNPTKGSSEAIKVFDVSYGVLSKIRVGQCWKDIRCLYNIPPLTSRAKFID